MKHIERYLSAYVVYCLFGGREDAHLEYVFQVLRESGSVTAHPVLSKVLDFIRQPGSDPANQNTQVLVGEYVRAMLNTPAVPQAAEWTAKFTLRDGIVIFKVYRHENLYGVAMADADQLEIAIEELKQALPGVQITQV